MVLAIKILAYLFGITIFMYYYFKTVHLYNFKSKLTYSLSILSVFLFANLVMCIIFYYPWLLLAFLFMDFSFDKEK